MARAVLRPGYPGARKIQRLSAGGYADFADCRPAEPEARPDQGSVPTAKSMSDARADRGLAQYTANSALQPSSTHTRSPLTPHERP